VGCAKEMTDCQTNVSKLEKSNPDWVLVKCLLEAQRETMQAMELYTLSAMTPDAELTNREIKSSLIQARRKHERAIEDIDTALSTLRSAPTDHSYKEFDE